MSNLFERRKSAITVTGPLPFECTRIPGGRVFVQLHGTDLGSMSFRDARALLNLHECDLIDPDRPRVVLVTGSRIVKGQ